jgi:RimJ/RimL family protein N-acetyltransferase
MWTIRRRSMLAWIIGRAMPPLFFIWLGLAFVAGAVLSALLGPAVGVPAAAALAWSTAVWSWPRNFIRAQRRLQRAMEGLETERLLLRRPVPDDAAAFAATIDATIIETNGWTDRVVRQLCHDVPLGLATPGQARVLVTDKRSGEVLGWVEANSSLGRQPICEVGWSMGAAARGRGYGTEALQVVFPALHAAGIASILIGTSPENTAALRVLEKLGVPETGRTLHRLPNGRSVPSVWHVHGDAPGPLRNQIPQATP